MQSRSIRRKFMMFGASLMVGSVIAACGSSASSSAKATHLQNVSLEYPNPGAAFLPFFVGKEDGIYKKYGIDLHLTHALPPPLAVSAILSGKLDFMSAIGSAGSAGIDGRPMRVYDVVASHLDFVMVAGPGITSVSQLSGKVIAGESAVSEANLIEKLMLQHAGVPVSSVKFDNITGGDFPRADLVLAGKAQATVVEIASAEVLAKKGLHIIANAQFIEDPFTGLATSTTFADSHKQLMKSMIKATTEATNIVRTDESKTLKAFDQPPLDALHLSVSEQRKVWKYVQSEWSSSPIPPTVAVQNQLSQWQSIYKLKTLPPASKAFDFSFARAVS